MRSNNRRRVEPNAGFRLVLWFSAATRAIHRAVSLNGRGTVQDDDSWSDNGEGDENAYAQKFGFFGWPQRRNGDDCCAGRLDE